MIQLFLHFILLSCVLFQLFLESTSHQFNSWTVFIPVFINYKLFFHRASVHGQFYNTCYQINTFCCRMCPFYRIPVLWQSGGYHPGSSLYFVPPTPWNRTVCLLHGLGPYHPRNRTGRTQSHRLAGSNLRENADWTVSLHQDKRPSCLFSD